MGGPTQGSKHKDSDLGGSRGAGSDPLAYHRDRGIGFGYRSAVNREDVLHASPDVERHVHPRHARRARQAHRVVKQRLITAHHDQEWRQSREVSVQRGGRSTVNVRPVFRFFLVRVWSSRSASVSCCPHSQSKKVRAERQTDSGPPSTTFSPHSSQRRTTCLPEPTTSTPSASLFLRGRHPLITNWSPQGEPASTMRDLCFTRYCLNPQLRFRLARGSGSASRAG